MVSDAGSSRISSIVRISFCPARLTRSRKLNFAIPRILTPAICRGPMSPLDCETWDSSGSSLRCHVGAEDGVDAGLVAGALAEPAEQVGVEAHGDDFFGHRHDNLGVFPEGFVGGGGVGIGKNSAAYFGRRHTAQPLPVRAARVLGKGLVRLRYFASSGVFRAAPSARPI